MAIIGIDLGTTNSLACVWKDGASQMIPNSLGSFLTPSVVGIDDDGSILVGEIAKQRLVSHPDQTIGAFKRFMGTQQKYQLMGQIFTPEDLSALVLRSLIDDARQFLGEEITEAVISVPAYFSDDQRFATKQAGQLSGVVVNRLINEPSAAALAMRMQDLEEDRRYLVFDFGGGTMDVSVVDCFDDVVEIISIAGDNYLGGHDVDMAIVRYFCEINGLAINDLPDTDRAVLFWQAEQCKYVLGRQKVAIMSLYYNDCEYFVTLTEEKLVVICAGLFKRIEGVILRALRDAHIHIHQLDQVIMVGGSSKMPVMQKYVAHLLQNRPIICQNPDEIVAAGIGVYTGIKSRGTEIKDMLLTDVCPFTLGVAIHSPDNDLMMSPVIERNSALPCSREEIFHTVQDMQQSVDVQVYQGDAMRVRDNLRLGALSVAVPQGPKGINVKVRFTYDINGILEVEVRSDTETAKTLLLQGNYRLTQEQAQQRLAQLAALKLHPRDKDENRLLLAKAARLYMESSGQLRALIAQNVKRFDALLATQDEYLLRRERPNFEKFLLFAENSLYNWDCDIMEDDGDKDAF